MQAEAVSKMDRLMIPLNRNMTEGMMERASARNTLFFRKQTAHMAQ